MDAITDQGAPIRSSQATSTCKGRILAQGTKKLIRRNGVHRCIVITRVLDALFCLFFFFSRNDGFCRRHSPPATSAATVRGEAKAAVSRIAVASGAARASASPRSPRAVVSFRAARGIAKRLPGGKKTEPRRRSPCFRGSEKRTGRPRRAGDVAGGWPTEKERAAIQRT